MDSIIEFYRDLSQPAFLTSILGISAFYHDSAAALIVDGQLVAAAQEERFSRIKHDASFPLQAIDYCLQQAGLSRERIDHVVFYEKPLLKFERIVESHLVNAPRGFDTFRRSIPIWLKEKLYQSRLIEAGLKHQFRRRIVFPEHHQSHAASAFFTSPFETAAILTTDGVGEWATTTLGTGSGNQLELSHQLSFPHSLGLLYSAFTAFCGFRVNGGEGKLMGLAPYGEPEFVDTIVENLVDLRSDGSFALNLRYFDFPFSNRMTSRRFAKLFGGPPRVPESPLTQREKNLAASIQSVTEDLLLAMTGHLHQLTGSANLCFSGGVALNCVANGRLMRDSPFENIWVPPAPGDAGCAIGAALFLWYQLLGNPRPTSDPHALDHAASRERWSVFVGPGASEDETRTTLDAIGADYRRLEASSLVDLIAGELDAGKLVGWYQGRMEFGPRALGHRSILADPRHSDMKDRINRCVKFRELFRPFAPIVLRSGVDRYFQWHTDSPYMTMTARVNPDADAHNQIPAVTHVDGTSRIQTVDHHQNPKIASLLNAFAARTGCPMLVNTSFNVRGQPIVASVDDAYDCFMKTELDLLVIDDFVLEKSRQSPESASRCEARLAQHSASHRAAHLTGWRSWLQAGDALFHRLTWPIQWAVSYLALAAIFYLVFVPLGQVVGWFQRRAARHQLELKGSYWQRRKSPKSRQSYFRQF